MEFTFVLTEREAQMMLGALAQMPYAQVVDLINKIQGQAKEQKDAAKGT